jgi:DNA-binding CsgD family transcriptional regulator
VWEAGERCAGLVLHLCGEPHDPPAADIAAELARRRLLVPLVLLLEPAAHEQTAGSLPCFVQTTLLPLPDNVLADHITEVVERWTPLRNCGREIRCFEAIRATLTARERLILERLTDGVWVKRIAAELGTSPHTVRNQRAALLAKFQLPSLDRLLRLAWMARNFELWSAVLHRETCLSAVRGGPE